MDAPLTAIVVRKDEGWRIWWAGIAASSPGGAFQTLDWLVEATDSLLRESGGAFQSLDALLEATDGLVRSRESDGGGCFQYKIYPWGRPGIGDERAAFDVFPLRAPGKDGHHAERDGPAPTSFNIWGQSGDLHADEIASGATIEVRGRTPEDLVNRVAEIRGEQPDAFIWILDIGSLQIAE